VTTVNISFTHNTELCTLTRSLQDDQINDSMIEYVILHSINNEAEIHGGNYEDELKECGVDYSSIEYEEIKLL